MLVDFIDHIHKMKSRERVGTIRPSRQASAARREGGRLAQAQCRTWHGSTPALVSRPLIGQNPVVGSAAANHRPALTGISSNQMTSC